MILTSLVTISYLHSALNDIKPYAAPVLMKCQSLYSKHVQLNSVSQLIAYDLLHASVLQRE